MPLLWILVIVLVLGWGGGFAFHVGGEFIHLLIVLAIICALYQLFVSNRGGNRPIL